MHVYVWRTTFSIGCCSSNNVCMILTHIQAFSFNYSHIGSGSGPAAASYTQQPVKDVPTDDQWAPHGGILDTSQWIFPHIHFFLYPIKLLLPSINGSASFAPRIPSLVAVDPQMTEMQSITGDSVELQRSGSGMWENRTRLPPALHQNVNIWASFYPWRGFFAAEWKKERWRPLFKSKSAMKELALPPLCALSGIFHLDFPCIKARDTTGFTWAEILLQKLLAPCTMAL